MIKLKKYNISFLFFFISIIVALNSTISFAMPDTKSLATAKILPYTVTTPRPNEFIVGLDIKLKDGWKTYWKIPGDAGLPPSLDWSGSSNLNTTPEILWPTPVRFEKYGIQNIGYKKHVIFPIKIKVTDKNKDTQLKLNLTLLICDEICVPFQQKIEQIVRVDNNGGNDTSPLLKAVENLPKVINNNIVQEITIIENSENPLLPKLHLAIKLPKSHADQKASDIFVYNSDELFFDKAKIEKKTNDIITATIPLRIELDEGDKLKSLLENGKDFDITIAFKNARAITADLKNKKIISINTINQSSNKQAKLKNNSGNNNDKMLLMITLAFIGGVILNIMPCVLPVLSLKFLSVIKSSDKTAQHIRIGFVASSLGILTAFWIMAGVISALKLAGHSIGWGMQFQNTYFLVFLCSILIIFAMNLWGIFEIHLPNFINKRLSVSKHHDSDSIIGNFMTGVLATVLATPCSAPFLGTAVGFALSQNPYIIFVIFTFLGLGLATPYILVAIFPKIATYMPKPGKWMITVKKIMAVALLATAIWLGSIAIHNIAGRHTQEITDNLWHKFTIEKLEQEITKGKIVFVDITADWCITCKANKNFIIDNKEVMKLLANDNVVLLVGDWTEMDKKLTKYINSFNKYGIPLNVIYGPKAKDGILLPELLSKTAIKEALIRAGLEEK